MAWQKNTLIISIIVFLDQLTKYYAEKGTMLFDTPLLSFSFVKNTGSSFGMLQGWNPYLIWISIIFIGIIIYYWNQAEQHEKTPLVLITAGIIGNFIDRITLGYVIDFIDLHWWPVFNIADSAIVIGVILFIIKDFQNSSASSKASK